MLFINPGHKLPECPNYSLKIITTNQSPLLKYITVMLRTLTVGYIHIFVDYNCIFICLFYAVLHVLVLYCTIINVAALLCFYVYNPIVFAHMAVKYWFYSSSLVYHLHIYHGSNNHGVNTSS